MRLNSVRESSPNGNNVVGGEEAQTTKPAAQPRSSADAWHEALTARNNKLMDNADKSPFTAARRKVAENYKKKGLPGPIAQFAAAAKLGLKLGFNANKKLGAVPTHEVDVPFSPEKAAEQQAADKAEKLSRDIRAAKAKLPNFEDDEELPISRAGKGLTGARDSVLVTRSHITGQSTQRAVTKEPSNDIESIRQKLLDFQSQTAEKKPSAGFRGVRDSMSLARKGNPPANAGPSGEGKGDSRPISGSASE